MSIQVDTITETHLICDSQGCSESFTSTRAPMVAAFRHAREHHWIAAIGVQLCPTHSRVHNKAADQRKGINDWSREYY